MDNKEEVTKLIRGWNMSYTNRSIFSTNGNTCWVIITSTYRKTMNINLNSTFQNAILELMERNVNRNVATAPMGYATGSWETAREDALRDLGDPCVMKVRNGIRSYHFNKTSGQLQKV